jgi:hypothetical protein
MIFAALPSTLQALLAGFRRGDARLKSALVPVRIAIGARDRGEKQCDAG